MSNHVSVLDNCKNITFLIIKLDINSMPFNAFRSNCTNVYSVMSSNIIEVTAYQQLYGKAGGKSLQVRIIATSDVSDARVTRYTHTYIITIKYKISLNSSTLKKYYRRLYARRSTRVSAQDRHYKI